jgi:hypothetical protein
VPEEDNHGTEIKFNQVGGGLTASLIFAVQGGVMDLDDLLKRVPERESFSSFRVNTIEDKDLANLSAATGDKFALLRGKNDDILYHGNQYHCNIEKSEALMELLESHKVILIGKTN